MTRINCVPVECLTDQHLLAEYKEITRPFTKMRKRLKLGNLNFTVPYKYVLGKGHESFFFDKLQWLSMRHLGVFRELIKRNFKLNEENFHVILHENITYFSGTPYWNNWKPTPEEIYLNMARLCHRHFKDELGDFK